MSKIFISYRQKDSAPTTQLVYRRLIGRFGQSAVFMDVSSIPYGVDFKRYIGDVLQQCAVMLVIIGPKWLAGSEREQAWARIAERPCAFHGADSP